VRPRPSRALSGAALLVALAGCGRIGYGSHDGVDPAPDAMGAPDARVVESCAFGELVCGNFEDGAGAWTLRGNTGNTSVAVVTAPGRGGGALRIRTDVDGDGFAVAEQTFPPVATGALYGRLLLWVSAATRIDDFVVALQLDDGNDLGTQKLSLDLLPYGGFVVTATTAHPAVRPGSPGDAIKRDQWMCLTFAVDLDAQRGAVRIDQGPRRMVSISDVDTVPDPDGYHRLLLAAVAPRPIIGELLFDAVALGRLPLACP
jgi:hypothetical protein